MKFKKFKKEKKTKLDKTGRKYDEENKEDEDLIVQDESGIKNFENFKLGIVREKNGK